MGEGEHTLTLTSHQTLWDEGGQRLSVPGRPPRLKHEPGNVRRHAGGRRWSAAAVNDALEEFR